MNKKVENICPICNEKLIACGFTWEKEEGIEGDNYFQVLLYCRKHGVIEHGKEIYNDFESFDKVIGFTGKKY